VLVLVTLLFAVTGFDTAYGWMPLSLLALSFALMANGAGLWGVLSADLPRIFGEMTYSIYLLHGPLLFVAFRFVLGFDWVVQLDPLQYWVMVALLTPLLLGVSACSFKFLERPCTSKTAQYTAWLKGLRISNRAA
jgi:peptidoglycan/LPS O-acetylase OafA/YrhL